MQKSFNKTREHFHVPLLLVMINFLVVTVIYYWNGYFNHHLTPTELNKAFLSGISLLGVLLSLFFQREKFTRFIYILSLLSFLYLFWG